MLDIDFDDSDEELRRILEQAQVIAVGSNRCMRTEHERLKIGPR